MERVRGFRVWAPAAQKVEFQLGGQVLPMVSGRNGWWHTETEAAAGTDYQFIVNGGDPLPDPRSPWQPYGVHGPSRVVDHSSFDWSDRQWQAPPLSSAVIYEMHVGTFTPEGTFEAAAGRLEHLVRLGITHVQLMPVNEFPGDWGWGYDGADLFAPHHAYGGPAGLKLFVSACHAAGLAVLLDVVYNHLGPSGNYLARFGPYFTNAHSTPWGSAVNLDQAGSAEVRRFFCDNALMWLRDYHCDGLRIDAVHAIFDQSAEHFLEQLAAEVKQLEAHLGRRLVLIAESDLNDPRIVMPRECGGYGIDAQWSDDFHHALHAFLTGERAGYYGDFGTLADIAKALRNAFVYDGRYSGYRQRRHGRKAEGLPGWRFLGYLQTHDQAGNRARGERSSQLMSFGRLKIGAALVMCAPFIPMLFQGEEFGASTPFQYFTNHTDPDLGRAVSEGRRRDFAAFGWKPEEIPDPQHPSSFHRSKLDWSTINPQLLEWHRRLIALRSSAPELTDGRLNHVQVNYSESEVWLVLTRSSISTVCNFAPHRRKVPVACAAEILLASETDCELRGNAVELPSDSVAITRSRNV